MGIFAGSTMRKDDFHFLVCPMPACFSNSVGDMNLASPAQSEHWQSTDSASVIVGGYAVTNHRERLGMALPSGNLEMSPAFERLEALFASGFLDAFSTRFVSYCSG